MLTGTREARNVSPLTSHSFNYPTCSVQSQPGFAATVVFLRCLGSYMEDEMRWQQDYRSSAWSELGWRLCHMWLAAGENPQRPLHVFLGAAAEHFGAGRASLPGFNPAADLPSGLILRHHRNRHQHARSPAGERTNSVIKIKLFLKGVGIWCPPVLRNCLVLSVGDFSTITPTLFSLWWHNFAFVFGVFYLWWCT